MSIYDEGFDEDGNKWDHERQQYVSSHKIGKPLGRGERHIPNSAERKELVRLMKKSGMSEEEVRRLWAQAGGRNWRNHHLF